MRMSVCPSDYAKSYEQRRHKSEIGEKSKKSHFRQTAANFLTMKIMGTRHSNIVLRFFQNSWLFVANWYFWIKSFDNNNIFRRAKFSGEAAIALWFPYPGIRDNTFQWRHFIKSLGGPLCPSSFLLPPLLSSSFPFPFSFPLFPSPPFLFPVLPSL